MTTTVGALRLRAVMGRDKWRAPQPFGPDGWRLFSNTDPITGTIIVTTAPWAGYEITHASMSYTDRVPSYDELCLLHGAVWGDTGFAYQVFVPTTDHVNLHTYALHLWGRSDGVPMLPLFGMTLPDGRRSI